MSLADKKISVIGLGYIGLPTAALLSNSGYKVNGYDINKETIDIINRGKIHIIEPDLEKYVELAVSSGSLKAVNELEQSDIFIICVPTPFIQSESFPLPDISFIENAIDNIIPVLKKGDLIILESTSPVGTTEKIRSILEQSNINTNDIHIAYCPERVLPGRIMLELVENDRIVGGINSISTEYAANFYETFVKGKIHRTNARTAEMCKLTENSYRDVNIAFANELSMICEDEDIDVWELINLTNKHPRVNILNPGVGVGGHCIAVDPWFIVNRNPEKSVIIQNARKVNINKTEWVINKIEEAIKSKSIQRPVIACLGLAFKPDIDDLRESPAIQVVRELIKKKYDVISVEPNISNNNELNLQTLEYALDKANFFVLLVNHKEFNLNEIKKVLINKETLDFCGTLSEINY